MKKSMIQFLFFAFVAVAVAFSFWACQPKPTEAIVVAPFSEVITPDWAKNAVIYEVNIRQFTPEGTFNAFTEHLPRLKSLGVDVLWLMPIHPIGELNRKGGLGSYYSVRDYKAVNPEFGTLDDFKLMVNKAHELGFKVILDWVANHTSFDHAWTTEHPEWYTRDKDGNIVSPFDWTDVADLNYDNNQELWAAMTDALKYWVSETQVDGYRCDVAGMVPVAFWEQARMELDRIKPVFMLAEDEGQRDLMQRAFDANYAWEFHHIMNQIAKGEKNAADIWTYFAKEDTLFAPSSYRMMFTSNHDENSWNGTEFERLGDGAKAFAVMTYTLPGFPLIYNGQETGLDRRLSFFEKDSIVWDANSEYAGFYANLNTIKHDNKSLWNGSNGGTLRAVGTDKSGEILSFTREKDQNKMLVLINLTNNEQQFKLFETNLNGAYTNLLTNEAVELDVQKEILLPAWGSFVLKAN